MNYLKAMILALIFGVFTLSGCFININDDDGGFFNCVDGNGAWETRVLNMETFSGIKVDLPVDVYITQGDDFSVEVEGKEDILDELDLDVNNDVWKIETDKCVRDVGNMKVYITMPTIKFLSIPGSGKIVGENEFIVDDIELKISGSGDIDIALDADDIEASIPGSGEIWMEGSADHLDFKISGSGDLNGFNLICEDVDVRISGSGDARVHVLDNLYVNITGSGDVYYKGNPSIDSTISGSGDLVDAN
jgi:hypothetical protein